MALPIVGLVSLLVGVTLAYTGAIVLRQYGGDIYIADLIGLSMVREMGAVMTAVVLAGRTGAAFAATLGNMKVNEEIDALEVLDWLCAQPWCDGNLGMMGISWGGFNGLQVAAHQPAALKAIITLCSTDDRYADDIHYKGGNLLMENQGWAATMLNFSAAVPDPLLVPDWQAQWQQRLDAMPMLAETWLQHQTRDDYWRQGSVCEDYAAIKAAVYCIGGWGDAFKM